MPDWHHPDHAPDERNLPQATAAWSSATYDPSLVGRNKLEPVKAVHEYSARVTLDIGDEEAWSKLVPNGVYDGLIYDIDSTRFSYPIKILR